MIKIQSRIATAILALEATYDRMVGKKGAAKAITSGVGSPMNQVTALGAAIQSLGHKNPEQEDRNPLNIIASAGAGNIVSRKEKEEQSALEIYEQLLRENPRQAGQFYSENADQITSDLSARTREQFKEMPYQS